MLTLNEAREIQKAREKKAIISFTASILLIALGSFLLFYFTDLLELSTVFYLIPIGLFGFAVKKTEIYKLFSAKEFTGKVVRMDVYPVKVGTIKGDDTYEQDWGEALEVSIIVDDGKRSKTATLYAGKDTALLSVGDTVALLRFIYVPVMIVDYETDIHRLSKAKKIFIRYGGSHFHMARDDMYESYKQYSIPPETEREWLIELKNKHFAKFSESSNAKDKTTAFCDYGDVIALLKDSSAFEDMLTYLEKNSENIDSNSLLIKINTVLNVANAFENDELKNKTQNSVKTILENALKNPIVISEDYLENGAFPEYLTAERIKTYMQDLLNS